MFMKCQCIFSVIKSMDDNLHEMSKPIFLKNNINI